MQAFKTEQFGWSDMNKAVGVGVVAVLGAAAAWWVYAGRTPQAGAAAEASAGAASGAMAAAPAGSAASGAGGGPVSVTTVRAEKRDQPVLLDANGTVTSLNSVDIHPQVSSVVTKVHAREGQFVKAGELLFTLDDRVDQVNITKAQAQLQKDDAALADAQRQLLRSQDLVRQGFVSQGAVDTAQTLVDSQRAVVAADRAAVAAVRVAQAYSRITAPSSGRVGSINVFAGSYVQPNGAALVNITQLDPIAVSFSLPQRNLADALAALRSGAGEVTVQLPDGGSNLKGKLQFVDSAVDATSGNVRVKAQFDNKEQKLWPGAYLNVRMVVRTLKDAIVVPQAAIIQSPKGKLVYVLEAGRAAARKVELVYAVGNDAVVTGVAAGDKVILDGRQNLRPGAAAVERSASGAGRGEGKGEGKGGGMGGGMGKRASDAASGAVAAVAVGAAGASAGAP
jgi:RND family efflux transporter MFP subunit